MNMNARQARSSRHFAVDIVEYARRPRGPARGARACVRPGTGRPDRRWNGTRSTRCAGTSSPATPRPADRHRPADAGPPIGRMAVLPDWRGRGVGEAMLLALIGRGRQLRLARGLAPRAGIGARLLFPPRLRALRRALRRGRHRPPVDAARARSAHAGGGPRGRPRRAGGRDRRAPAAACGSTAANSIPACSTGAEVVAALRRFATPAAATIARILLQDTARRSARSRPCWGWRSA